MPASSPSGRSRPRRADVRAQLLAAAAAALAEQSYADVSVAAIAEAAGFTKGAVYSNFGGKPQLFAAVLAEQFSEVVGGVLALALATAETERPAEVPRAVAASLARDVVRDHRLPALLAEFRALAIRDAALAEVYAQLRVRQRSEVEQLLARVAERVPLTPGLDLAVAATLLLTCVNSIALEHAAAPQVLPEPVIEALLTHVVSGLLA